MITADSIKWQPEDWVCIGQHKIVRVSHINTYIVYRLTEDGHLRNRVGIFDSIDEVLMVINHDNMEEDRKWR